MSVSVLFGLALQALAVVIMHVAVRGRWLRHCGALLLAAAVVYHGLTELICALAPGYNRTRPQVEAGALDDWVLLVSATLLIYTIGYTLVLRARPAPVGPAAPGYASNGRRVPGRTPAPGRHRAPDQPVAPGDRRSPALDGLRLGWLAAAALPLIYLCLQGRGTVQSAAIGAPVGSRDNYVSAGLATQFLVFVLAVTSLVLLARIGHRWLLPVLALQSALLAFVGIRSMIVVAAVLVLAGMTRCGLRVSPRALAGALIVIVLIGLTISSTRAVVGRDAFDSDRTAGQRLTALAEGFTQISSAPSRQAIVTDLVPRFDANTFGALVLRGLREGARPVGLETVRNDVFLAVPSFLNSDKLSEPLERRNEDYFFVRHFGLHYGTDYLPGLFGFLLGYYGPAGLPVLAGLLALLLGRADRWLAARQSRTRLLLALGLLQCVVLYTNLPSGFFLTGRGVLLIVVLTGVLPLLRASATVRERAHRPVRGRGLAGARHVATARPAVGDRLGWR